MDVDKHNFKKVYDYICHEKLVERSECVSIDLEFTGLRFDNNEKERHEDYIYQRYEKMRNVVKKYSIIQIGLTFFQRTASHINAWPFNFYVYPRAYKNTNPTVCLQSSTIEFNTKNGMDWNRWIRDGITFIPLDKTADALSTFQKQSTYQQLEQKLSEQQGVELLMARDKMQKLLQNADKQQDEIQVSSTFVRLVIERLIDKQFPGIYLSPFNCDSPLKEKLLLNIRKVDSKDRQQIQREINLSLIGFTAIFEMIWKRPNLKVIGHNSFFDLLYIMNSFVSELPNSYIKFKEQANIGFPNYYDTKHLSSKKEFAGIFNGGTSLEELLKVILTEKYKTETPLIEISLGEQFKGYDWNNSDNKIRLHQAGYDSYLTGWIFYQLANRLKDLSKCESRVPVMRSVWDINLKITADEYNEYALTLVIIISKPKQFIINLFQYKKKKTYETMEILNDTFTRERYNKDDVKLREYKVDFIFVDLRNNLKRKEFIADMCILKEKGLDIRTMGSLVKERIEQIDPNKK